MNQSVVDLAALRVFGRTMPGNLLSRIRARRRLATCAGVGGKTRQHRQAHGVPLTAAIIHLTNNYMKSSDNVCAICDAVQQGALTFAIGAKGADDTENWCMVAGTGVLVCPACYPAANERARRDQDSLAC